MLANLGPAMGPPYSSTEMHRREFSVAVEQVGSRAVVQLAAESKAQPGLVLRERVTVAPTGLVEASGWLENHGEQTREAAVRLMVGRGDTDLLQMAVPLPDGIVVANAPWWPRMNGDISRDPAAYAEPWQIWQGLGIAAGVAWGAGVQQLRTEWRITAAGAVQTLAAGERSQPLAVALYGQPGDWQDVRPRLCAWAGMQPKTLAGAGDGRGGGRAAPDPDRSGHGAGARAGRERHEPRL